MHHNNHQCYHKEIYSPNERVFYGLTQIFISICISFSNYFFRLFNLVSNNSFQFFLRLRFSFVDVFFETSLNQNSGDDEWMEKIYVFTRTELFAHTARASMTTVRALVPNQVIWRFGNSPWSPYLTMFGFILFWDNSKQTSTNESYGQYNWKL